MKEWQIFDVAEGTDSSVEAEMVKPCTTGGLAYEGVWIFSELIGEAKI